MSLDAALDSIEAAQQIVEALINLNCVSDSSK